MAPAELALRWVHVGKGAGGGAPALARGGGRQGCATRGRSHAHGLPWPGVRGLYQETLRALPSRRIRRFVLGRALVASAVVGATSPEQLRQLLTAAGAGPLPPEVLEEVDAVHARLPNPAP